MRNRALKYVILVIGVIAFILFLSCSLPQPPQPAPPPYIEISSNPGGAIIIIDGVRQPETTPAEIRIADVNANHTIQIEKEGYYPATDIVEPLISVMYNAPRPKTSFHFELKLLPSQQVKQLNPSSLKINLSDTDNYFVGVMDVNLSGDIPMELQMPLTNAIISELVGLGKFKVIDRANREAILRAQAAQLAVCPEGKCSVVEVGRLIGVNRMAISYISQIGNSYYITLTMVNVETGLVEGFSESTVTCDISELPIHLKSAARGLFK